MNNSSAVSGSRSGNGLCLICSNETKYFFSRTHHTYPGSPFPGDLEVDYWKCVHCGFVISKTHQEMSAKDWADLNTSWHHYGENKGPLIDTNQPPYLEQALSICVLTKNNLLKRSATLDYAAGYGSLSKIMDRYLNIQIQIFDNYVVDCNIAEQYVKELQNQKYDLVINSAMFEHILDRQSLDIVDGLVTDDGVLMIHTVICENIPKDPTWFYMKPTVHTAFHTNKSMSILMGQWGYSQSIYCPSAKAWFLYKGGSQRYEFLLGQIKKINEEMQCQYLHYKRGFVDYWKGF